MLVGVETGQWTQSRGVVGLGEGAESDERGSVRGWEGEWEMLIQPPPESLDRFWQRIGNGNKWVGEYGSGWEV